MKTIVLILTVIIFSLPKLKAQEITKEQFDRLTQLVGDIEKDRDTLKNNFNELKLRSVDIEQKLLAMHTASFEEMQALVRDAFDKTDVISSSATYQEVIKSIILLHNEITKVNNFTDAKQVFGFDFVKQITSIAESTLINQMVKVSENESQELANKRKNRIRGIIKNIVSNPVIIGFFKSNPITSVAHSIINQTISAETTQIKDVQITRGDYQMPTVYKDFKKEYDQFKTSYETSSLVGLPVSQRLIMDNSIDAFTKELKPLIKLFDDLSKINEKYESSLGVFIKASEQTIERAKPIEKEFYRKLETEKRLDARNKINQFFNVGTKPSLALLENKLNDLKMNSALDYVSEVDEVYILLKNDFMKVISLEIELATEYISFFDELKKGKEGLPDFENTDALDDKINKFSNLKKSLETEKDKLEEQ